MIYDIKLRIGYDYTSPVGGGRHVVRVLPLEIPGEQRVSSSLLSVSPEPEERRDRTDFFGNGVTEFALRRPHGAISVTAQCRVERLLGHFAPGEAVAGTSLDALAAEVGGCRDLGPSSPVHFAAPSARVPYNAQMTQFARLQLHDGMTAAEAVVAIGRALHAHMKFDPKATTVDTPAADAFARRRGVCQDFSHIMIACLRGIGIPAGYVSGYLRTLPPKGQPRLEGADAMHAWVRAWCGAGRGWVSFDPTNDIAVGIDHVTVAHGRDYADVSPIRGILRISGSQTGHQAVDMRPVLPA